MAKSDLKGERSSPEDVVDPPHQPRNFILLALYHVCMRTGWIFKTESIIMPAVLDLIGGQGWLRGCLPMLNRFGQSIPPLLASDWLRNRKIKKWALVTTSIVMGLCCLTLALVWAVTGGEKSWWLPIVFDSLCSLFCKYRHQSTGL